MDEYAPFFKDFDVNTLNWHFCQPRSINPLRELCSFISLAKTLIKLKPDYMLSFTVKGNIYAGLINIILKSKHLPTITGIGLYFPKHLYFLSLRTCNKVIFQNFNDVSIFLKKKIISNEQPIIFSGSGVDVKTFQPNTEIPFQNRFLFVSRYPLEKGIYHIIQASYLLKKSHPNWSIDFYGYPSTEFSYLPSNVNFRGFSNHLNKIYGLYSCFLYCKTYREGLPKVLLEAISSGLPILAAGSPIDYKLVKPGYTGFKTSQLDSNKIYNLMIKWIHYPDSKKWLMRKNARKLALKKFSETKIACQYWEILKE